MLLMTVTKIMILNIRDPNHKKRVEVFRMDDAYRSSEIISRQRINGFCIENRLYKSILLTIRCEQIIFIIYLSVPTSNCKFSLKISRLFIKS